MQLAQELILKKRDGLPLSKEEIESFVHGVVSHDVSDAQIAAFAMATWFRGMGLDEQMALTLAMRDSGSVLEWSSLDGPVLDKHSTGGVGDMVSLLLGPIVASCGAYVPMISGRGLGHTGGTLDKLESIPGFNTQAGIQKFQQLVRQHRIAIVGQTDELARADRRIYAVRDVTATVASTPLIISSILSKKLAEGLDALVLDIKSGSGAFTPAMDDAVRLAREISAVARQSGLPCHALVTDMSQPLAWSAGNALEVLETVRFLRGDPRHPRLEAVVIALSAELLQLGELADDSDTATAMAFSALRSGRAAEQFAAMVTAQGGPSMLLEKPELYLPVAGYSQPVFCRHSGYIQEMDMKAVGSAVVLLGGGRRRAEDSIDHSVGISDISGVGQRVDQDTPLAIVHAQNKNDWERAAERLIAAVVVGPDEVNEIPVVNARVGGEPPNAED
ncbi:MAG: thymidine phosphorylase [Xanthomonadales bacterium]|nr:thymidine phosphorylase [Gammaproteobacteria bacterium]MBT8055002.1 thymidine phosphorylase [Gammaproteobacteria bacterium]NND56384.1 thymidine phosphorylase [Xanthomonadales bacterium]NNK50441.1 thymidine phosphorylase [Xanthomonadales bacterium]